jgi:uncharacterized protein (TIGR02266 family)
MTASPADTVHVKGRAGVDAETSDLIREFVTLNRRRLRGNPPLGVAEFARWIDLRDRLEEAMGAGQKSGPRRRNLLRVPTHLKVRCAPVGMEDDLEAAPRSVHDISEGGLFVATESAPLPGTPLHLWLEGLDEGEPLEVEAVVVWVRDVPGTDGPAGMGIRFANLDDIQREAVAFLVEHALRSI